MKKFDCLVIFSLALTLMFADFFDFYATAQSIEEQTLRLHIVANSDSEEDQAAKLLVRDALLESTGDLFTTGRSKDQVMLVANSHIPLIESVAAETLSSLAINHEVVAYTTEMYFDTTIYEGFTMPAGHYNAVRIEIGDAQGHNWWCVLFPPLCLPSVQGDATVEAMYNEDELELIEGEYDIRFKSLEIIESIFNE